MFKQLILVHTQYLKHKKTLIGKTCTLLQVVMFSFWNDSVLDISINATEVVPNIPIEFYKQGTTPGIDIIVNLLTP